MTATALSLPVILPESILAAGVLVLLLIGAVRGEKSVWLVTEGAVAIIGIALRRDADRRAAGGRDVLRRVH